MNTRKLRVISLVFVCVAGVVVAGLLWPKRAGPEVQLVFVGYTNVRFEIRSTGSSVRDVVWTTKAVIAVTNYGSAPVKFASAQEAYPGSQIPPEIARTYLQMPGSVIEAGKFEIRTMYFPARELQWRANVAYRRQGWVETALDRARNSRWRSIQTMAKRILPAQKLRWVQSDWITNSPPAGRRYHITAPPPDIKIELPPLRPRQ